MPKPVLIKLGMYIMAPEPISKAYYINPSHHLVFLHEYPPIVARQRLGKNVIACVFVAAVTFLQNRCLATIEEYTLLDASFSMPSVSYQNKVGDQFSP
jgi:hypothetical protein